MQRYFFIVSLSMCIALLTSCVIKDEKANISEVTDSITTMDSEMAEMRNTLSEMDSLDKVFKEELAFLRDDLDELCDSKDELKSQILKDSSSITEMEEVLDVLLNKVYVLQESDSLLEAGIEELDARLDSLVGAKDKETREWASASLVVKEDLDSLCDVASDLKLGIDSVKTEVESLDLRLAALEEAIYGILTNVQSISVVPDLSDGSIRVKGEIDTFSVRLAIYPLSAADSIAKKGLPVTLEIVSGESAAAAVLDSLDITRVAYDDELLKLTVSNLKIPEIVKKNQARAFARVVFYAGDSRVASNTFPLSYILGVTGIDIEWDRDFVYLGKTCTLPINVTPENATDKRLTYRSLNPSVAYVSADGRVSGMKIGNADIIVSSVDNSALCDTCEVRVVPEGALSGKFSISATQQVLFSRGNLRAVKNKNVDSTRMWEDAEFHFPSSQMDVLGSANLTPSGQLADSVDLFGWSSSSGVPWGISTSTSCPDYGTQTLRDWSKKIGENWKVLSRGEWEYLIQSRPNANALLKRSVKIGGISGNMVIAPDDYTKELQSAYTVDEWKEAEKEGLVCFVHKGFRLGSSCYNEETDMWTSSYSSSQGSDFYIYSLKINSTQIDYDMHAIIAYCGFLVRPVYMISK